MAGPRQPIELVIAKGLKNLTKDEIEQRRETEVKPIPDGIKAPAFLTAKQRKEFDRIAGQLQKLKIMGETDCDTLARYVVAQELYAGAVKDLRDFRKTRHAPDNFSDAVYLSEVYDKLDKRIDRYFKQATTAASALGLTISSRCKLIVPVKDDAPTKVNKFSQFERAAGEE